jgi:hypothetical protein
MHFPLAAVLLLLPPLTNAAPRPDTGTRIPLAKRDNLLKRDGVVDIEYLKGHLAFTEALVSLFPFWFLFCIDNQKGIL